MIYNRPPCYFLRPDKDENKTNITHPSQEGNKKLNNESLFKKFSSKGGVSRSDGVGAFQFFTHHCLLITRYGIFRIDPHVAFSRTT